ISQQPWMHNMHTREHSRRHGGRGRQSAPSDTDDMLGLIDLDKTPPSRVRLLTQHHRGERLALLMVSNQVRYIELNQRISVEHDERLVAKNFYCLLQPTARSEDRRFGRVRDAHAKTRPVAQFLLDQVTKVVQVYDDILDAVSF